MSKLHGEQRLVNQFLVNHVLHRCVDRVGRDGVDARPSKTQETIVAAVREEAAAEFLCTLDGLVGDGDPGDGDDVGIDITRGRGAVSVRNVPGACGVLCGAGFCGVVDGVRPGVLPRICELGRPDPEVGRARVKVEVDGDARCSYLDWNNVFGTI